MKALVVVALLTLRALLSSAMLVNSHRMRRGISPTFPPPCSEGSQAIGENEFMEPRGKALRELPEARIARLKAMRDNLDVSMSCARTAAVTWALSTRGSLRARMMKTASCVGLARLLEQKRDAYFDRLIAEAPEEDGRTRADLEGATFPDHFWYPIAKV